MLTAPMISKILKVSRAQAYNIIKAYKKKNNIRYDETRYRRSDFKEHYGLSDEEIDKALES